MTTQFIFPYERQMVANASIQKVHDAYKPVEDELNALLNQASSELKRGTPLPYYVREIEWRVYEIRRLGIIAAGKAAWAAGGGSDEYFLTIECSTVPELAADYRSGRAAAERDYQRLQEVKAQRNDERAPVTNRITRCRFPGTGPTMLRFRAWTQGYATRWHELRRDDDDYRPGRLGEDLP
jgi:hypothetical protein